MAFAKFVTINVAALSEFGNKTFHRFYSCFGMSVGLGVVRSAESAIDSQLFKNWRNFVEENRGPPSVRMRTGTPASIKNLRIVLITC